MTGARRPGLLGRGRAGTTTSVALGVAAAAHVAWGLRIPIPGVPRDRMAEAVVGSDHLPTPAACFAVATALASAAALVGGAPRRAPKLRLAGQVGVALALGGRGALGLVGRTDLVAPGPTSASFRSWDRAVYTPLCLALCAGASRAAVSGWRTRSD
jgi:hypothetical protein